MAKSGCGTAMMVLATIMGPIVLVFLSVSFATDHWLEFDVNRNQLTPSVRTASETSVVLARYTHTRHRGLFKECYPGNDTIWWRFGAFMCKSTPYIQSVVQCASVNTLAAIAFDRYQAIFYSRHSKTTSCAYRTTIIFIWMFAFSIMIPLAVFYEQYPHPDYPDVPMCHQLWPTIEGQRAYFLTALFIICYLLPLSMIMLCYILIGVKVCKRNAPGVQATGRLIVYRSKVKVLKMLAVIVLLFALSWLPLYAVYLRFYFGGNLSAEANETIFSVILPIAQWLGSSNSGVNPIIYCFFSKKYRRGFRHILSCRVSNLPLWRQNTTNRSVSTRYVNVDNSSVPCVETNHDVNNRVSNKFMVVAFSNGRMTVSFRKENGSDESSF